MRKLLLPILLLLPSLSWAANFSGKWVIPPDNPGGNRNETVVRLNQTGGVVNGTVSSPSDAGTGSPVNGEIYDARVQGNTISFYVWRGSDMPAKLFFNGHLTDADEIEFHITGGPSRQGVGFKGVVNVPPVSMDVKAVRAQ
jgi:hypothetical protein